MITALANPKRFLYLSRIVSPWTCAVAVILLCAGFYWSLFATPPDYQQGQSVKIMFVHVPAAWMGIFVYSVMAGASLVGLVFRHPLADVAAKSAAPLGAAFTALALLTGSLWGRPMWGTYWQWGDARLVSELILLFIYLGYIGLWNAIDDQVRAAKAAAVLALVGAADVPKGIQMVLDEIGSRTPKAKTLAPESFIDVTYLKELEQSGFIKKLYGE